MSRRLLAWLFAVPLMLAGVEGGHWLAYRLVYPDPYQRSLILAGSGHAYLDYYAPFFLGVTAAVSFCALAGTTARRRSGRVVAGSVSFLPFLLLAPLAFAFQECFERTLLGEWPLQAVLTPTFLPGLLFQLPFAGAAYLAARWLLRVAVRLRLLALRPRSRPLSVELAPRKPGFVPLRRPLVAVLSAGCGVRGPPPLRLV
jgi:hypothetical protein